MRLSVACNFDDELIDALADYPVYEVYGKVSHDYAGGGRPSFYLPTADRAKVERTVKRAHSLGIQFNYLMNASCMGNAEYTREGQREIRQTLDWISEIGCDSVTVGGIFLLQIIKRCYPSLKVRISAHRFTDSPRKAAFWQDHGADCIVLNETAFAREFAALRGHPRGGHLRSEPDREQLVPAGLRHRGDARGEPQPRLAAPQGHEGVGAARLPHALLPRLPPARARQLRARELDTPRGSPTTTRPWGSTTSKIVERNTPTPELLRRVRAYSARRYEGNLFDLVLPFNYPEEAYTTEASREAYSLRRALRYFGRPDQLNITKVPKLVALGKRMALLYPRQGSSALFLDNRKLDGFIDRFLHKSCIDVDCESCRYCHEYADRAVTVDPKYHEEVRAMYDDLFADMQGGAFWESRPGDFVELGRLTAKKAREAAGRLLSRLS
ncbi:MAG: U32 family peptidase [Sandaracinaceae bacterium]|nr:U32 family peptidase [Sandaracinaceae bacterium]